MKIKEFFEGFCKRKTIMGMFVSIFVFLCILITFSSWARYWIYYKPFYTIFENSVYLPFYLYAARILILFGGLFVANLIYKFKIWAKLIMVLTTGATLFFLGRDIYKDIIFMNTEKYLTIECDLNTLKIHRSRRNRYYKIQSAARINGKALSIEMDFYQYNKLLKEQKENGYRIIMVPYLPNTKRMLMYRIM
jgi:hypothetical protein